MAELAAALEGSLLGSAMRGSLWLYPLVNVAHLLAVATIFGLVLATDLRLLGFGRALPRDALLRHTLPWIWGGFALAAASGILLLSADARSIAANPFFRLKLILLAAAGANAWLFHRRRAAWLGATSLALWLGIVVCGRLIAYW